MLVVARALRSAGEVLGDGETGVSIARVMLNALVLPASVDQAPKVQRQPFSKLAEIARSPETAARALQILQAEEIVRPAWGGAPEGAWQLDHDYLARPVLAEMRRADLGEQRLMTALRGTALRKVVLGNDGLRFFPSPFKPASFGKTSVAACNMARLLAMRVVLR
jgi:hypothetical protein